MTDDRDTIKKRLSKGVTAREGATENREELNPDSVVSRAMGNLMTAVIETPMCDMFLNQEQNPMIINVNTAPSQTDAKQLAPMFGVMDDGERDTLITDRQEKAEKLMEFAWESVQWQLAWVMAIDMVTEKLVGSFDNPEDDGTDIEDGTTSGQRMLRRIPLDSTGIGRFKAILYEALNTKALSFIAKETGLPEDMALLLLDSRLKDGPKTPTDS